MVSLQPYIHRDRLISQCLDTVPRNRSIACARATQYRQALHTSGTDAFRPVCFGMGGVAGPVAAFARQGKGDQLARVDCADEETFRGATRKLGWLWRLPGKRGIFEMLACGQPSGESKPASVQTLRLAGAARNLMNSSAG